MKVRRSIPACVSPSMKLALVALLLKQLIWVSLAQKRFNKPANVTFGVLFPVHLKKSLETCGGLYSFGLGLGYVEAISYAVDRINNDSSLLPNVTLGFNVWDYCNSRVLAVKSAHQITINNCFNELIYSKGVTTAQVGDITSPILAVIGTMGSSSTNFVASHLQVSGIPIISPFATSEELSSSFFSTFFRTIPPDGQQAKAMVSIIEYFHWKYVAVVAIDSSYGQYGVRALEQEAYRRQSFCIAFTEYFTASSYKDEFKNIIGKLKQRKNAQVIVLWADHHGARGLLDEAQRQELFGRTFLMSEAMSTGGKNVLEIHASVLEGSLGIAPHKHVDIEFETHLKNLTPQRTRQAGGIPWWKEFWRDEFNCSSSSSNTSLPACDDSLKISETGFQNIFNAYSPYVTDSVYAIAHAIDSIYRCSTRRNGNPLHQKCPRVSPSIRPRDVVEYLKNITFQGLTGEVHFSNSGNPITAKYDFINFQKNEETEGYSILNIGWWKNGETLKTQRFINDSLVRWNTQDNRVPESVCMKTCFAGFKQTVTVGCCWECLKCAKGYVNPTPGSPNCSECSQEQMSNMARTECVNLPVSNIRWKDGTALLFLALTIVGFLLTLFVLAVFIKHQNTPVVTGSNRELSYLLLLVISLCFILTILHLARPTDALCYVVQPWRYITCTLCVSVLFLKTNRLLRAFQTQVVPAWFKKYVLGRKFQVATVLLLNIVQIILTALWLCFDPPQKRKEVKTQQFVFLTCLPFETNTGLALRSTMFSYFIFLSLLCTMYAFKARRLPENFNEARYIGFSMYVLLLSWVAYYPVDSALEGAYITIVACSTALITAYGLLGCMFFPKVFVILKHPEKNTVEYVRASVGQFSFAPRDAKI